MVFYVKHGDWDTFATKIQNALTKWGCTNVGSLKGSTYQWVWGTMPIPSAKPIIRFSIPVRQYDDRVYIYLGDSIDPTNAVLTGAVKVFDNYDNYPHGYLFNAIPNETFVFKQIGAGAYVGWLATVVDGFDGNLYSLLWGSGYVLDATWDKILTKADFAGANPGIHALSSKTVALDKYIKATNVLVSYGGVYYGVARNIFYINFNYSNMYYCPMLKFGTDYYDLWGSAVWYKVDPTIE